MPKDKKIKRQTGGVRPCTKCYNPQYLKFNFAYFNLPKNFEDKYKAQMLNRMIELSKDTYLVLMQRGKAVGFELENLKINKEIPTAFKNRFEEKNYSKFTVIRLYPNNNPIVGRIVGVMIHQIFYAFYLFIGDNEGYKR